MHGSNGGDDARGEPRNCQHGTGENKRHRIGRGYTKQLRFDVLRAEPRAGDADDHVNREQATPARARAFEAHSDNRDRDRIQRRVFVQPSVRLDRVVSGFSRTAGILRELDADDVVRLAWSWGPL